MSSRGALLSTGRAFKLIKVQLMFERIAKTQPVAIAALIVVVAFSAVAQTPARSPSDTVREFYRTMRAKKFREAFAMSIYKAAIDPLSAQEFQDLLPDFERMASEIPEKLDITGEQISGENATVFMRVKEPDVEEKAQPISLIRIDGVWIVGDRENEGIVKKAGKEFFFKARIETHHAEVQDLFRRITLAQIAYSQQHNGQFGNLADLVAAGLIPKDLEGTESTGYRFQVNKSADSKTWYATAEPAQYGRTGRLSFYLDVSGIRSADNGGKPLVLKN
jgi:hypothetical protein